MAERTNMTDPAAPTEPQIPDSGLDYLKQLGKQAKATARKTPDGGLELMPDGGDGLIDEGTTPIPTSSAQTRVIKPGQPAPKAAPQATKPAEAAPKAPEAAPAKPAAAAPAPVAPQEPAKAPETPPEPPKVDPEALKDRMTAYRRTFLEKALPKPQPVAPQGLPKEVLEKADVLMAEGKSAEAYALISQETMNRAVTVTETRSETRAAQEAFVAERAEVNLKVFEAHPELLEFEEQRLAGKNPTLPDTPFLKELNKVYGELGDAFIAQNPRAPQIAMEMAESRLRDKVKTPEASAATRTAEQAAAEERTRAVTAMAGAAAGGSRVPAGAPAERVELDETQRRVAMKMRMSPEEYAKYGGGQRVIGTDWLVAQKPRRPGRA